MFVHYRTQGLIIKEEDKGESNQLFTIYTKDFGKLEILGKAIRKITSKLRAGADIFYLSEIELIQAKTHKTLTDAILIEKFENIRKSLRRLEICNQIAKVLDRFIRGQEPDERVWRLLTETFHKLNARYKTPNMVYRIYYFFLWNLISILGYKPDFYHCSLCQKGLLPEKNYFNLLEGGVICYKCSRGLADKTEASPEVIKILRIILKKDWNTFLKLKIDSFCQKSLKDISRDCLNYILSENE